MGGVIFIALVFVKKIGKLGEYKNRSKRNKQQWL